MTIAVGERLKSNEIYQKLCCRCSHRVIVLLILISKTKIQNVGKRFKNLYAHVRYMRSANMTPRLSGHFSIFPLVFFVLKPLLENARQWGRENFAILAPKPRSHVNVACRF